MELACDIPKQSKKIIIENKINDKFKKLRLHGIQDLHVFLSKIKKEKYIKRTTLLLEQYFQDVEKDMVDAVLMAYCISSFSDKLFDSYKSRFEQKLIFAANKVVVAIDKLIINSEPPSEFYNTIDHYVSLYKVWKSQDSINELTKLFEEIQNEIQIMNLQKKRGLNINTTKSKELIDKLFLKNSKYATRILLHSYDIFNNSHELEKYFWNCVKTAYQKYHDVIFVTLVSELKIRLIPLLTDPYDRKKIYYSIDTEELIQKISNMLLTNDAIMNIINIFGNKIKKINSKFIFETIVDDKVPNHIVNLFESLYHATLKQV